MIAASQGEPLDAARLKLHEHRIEKLPLVDAQDRVVGLITAQDIIKIQEHPQATKDTKGRLRVGVAVGVRTDDLPRAALCLEAGADVLVVDVAHGHTSYTIEMIESLKQEFPKVKIIAGNVATAQGVRDLAEAGADAVKVGVGSGSICITRIVTGFGVPQLTAVIECAQAGQSSWRAHHRRRRHPQLRRHHQGAGGWRQLGDAGQPAGWHRPEPRRGGDPRRAALQDSTWHGLSDSQHRSQGDRAH